MTFKHQCGEHGCSELLCGCPVSSLETSSDYWEQIRAKDKWIKELLNENEDLKKKNKEANNIISELLERQNEE